MISPVFRRLALPVLVLAVLAIAPAGACPVCGTDTGQQVRQGIFDDRFGLNVLRMLLPFPVFIAIVAALYHGRLGGKSGSATAGGKQRNSDAR